MDIFEEIVRLRREGRRAALATRNTRHFDDLSVPVINPWADGV